MSCMRSAVSFVTVDFGTLTPTKYALPSLHSSNPRTACTARERTGSKPEKTLESTNATRLVFCPGDRLKPRNGRCVWRHRSQSFVTPQIARDLI